MVQSWEFTGINKISYADASQYLGGEFLFWMLLGWERIKFYLFREIAMLSDHRL